MIPVSLTIKGLYSYQEEQTIDFGPLLDGQLFGIFGSVGSGKSSILEAISFALYGETERLNLRDNRSYNMMNLKSDDLLIDFIFSNFDGNLFRYMVKGKRNGKDFDKVNTFERTAYKKKGNEWLPLESASAESVIGLSYENFRRTIIIPQGKFQEFLQLGDKARTDMLKDIFQLGKYEFFYQTTSLDKRNSEAMQNLQGRLAQYEQLSAESMAEKEAVVNQLGTELDKQKATLSQKELHLKEQEGLKQLFDDLRVKQSTLASLIEQEGMFKAIEKKLTDYNYCQLNFKENLNRKKEAEFDITDTKQRIGTTTAALSENETQLAKAKQDFELVNASWLKQDERKTALGDYQLLTQLLNLHTLLQALNKSVETGQEYVDKAATDKQSYETQLKALKAEILEQKAQLPDLSKLSTIRTWYTTAAHHNKNHSALEHEKMVLQQKIAQVSGSINMLVPASMFSVLNLEHTVSQHMAALQQYRQRIHQQKEEVQSQIAHDELQLRLSEFTTKLANGEACPLCGSTEHPHILVVEDVNDQLEAMRKQLEKQKQEEEVVQDTLNALEGIRVQQLHLDQQMQELNRKMEQVNKEQQQHIAQFIWPEFKIDNADEVETLFKIAESQGLKINTAEAQLVELEKMFSSANEKYEKYNRGVEDYKTKVIANEAETAALKKHLKVLSFNQNDLPVYEQLIEEERRVKVEIEQVGASYESLLAYLETLNKEKLILTERLQTGDGQLQKAESLYKSIMEALEASLKASTYESWEEVNAILNDDFDVERSSSQLATYKQQLFSVEQMVTQLQAQTNDKHFDIEAFAALTENVVTLRLEMQRINDEYVKEKAVSQLQKMQWKEKQELQHQLDKLRARAENLNTLKQLFKGSGFVNYISSVYLQGLCNAANERFYKLTRQQLRLEVTDKNDFQVRDFMNDGKVRSVKTLSGGQTFQASLSLALALAESVQHQQSSKQNFFFLDEGFGSLDKEALQTVFETLRSLRKEDRIVGIISHVDELQQEIDVAIKVINDPIRGSLISYS